MNGLSTSDDIRLSNGLRVLTVPERRIPVAELRLVIPFARIGPEAASLDLLAACLLTSAGSRTRAELAEQVADCGGSLEVLAGPEELTISGSVLSTGLGTLLRLLQEILIAPEYTQAELNLARAKASGAPHQLSPAQRALLAQRFLNHPLAVDPVAALPPVTTPEELTWVHRTVLTPQESVLVLAGSIESAELALAAELLGAWTGPESRYAMPALHYRDTSEIVPLTERSGGGVVLLAAPAVHATDPRCAALEVANQILGGLTTSRLMRRLRGELGLVCSVTSTVQVSRGGRWLLLDTVGAPGAAERIVAAVLDQLAAFTPEPAEFEQARQHSIGLARMGVASLADLATAAASHAAHGGCPGWLLRHPERLRALTLAEVAEATAEFLRPHRFTGVAG